MGKIRIKTLGDEESEKKQKEESKKKAEAKKVSKIETTKEEILESPEKVEQAIETGKKPVKKEKFQQKQRIPRSVRYQKLLKDIDRTKHYPLSDAITMLLSLDKAKFDETVELHINTLNPAISGNVTLPHGTGKKTRVAIANDQVIAEIASGKINFDILLAEPVVMPKLAKVAKILGPKGLMPNPKNGTITTKPEEVAKKYQEGQINFKTETKTPLLHVTVGKLSFGKEKLNENILSMLNAVKISNIKDITIKSTMSPGIKVDFTRF